MKPKKFKPDFNYKDDIEFEKHYKKNNKLERKSNLSMEVEYFKKLNKTQIDDIKQIISSIESAVKESLQENPNLTYKDIEEEIFNLINNFISPLGSPTKNDLYLFKTIEQILKNPDIINTIISSHDMKEYLKFNKGPYSYTSNIKNNYPSLLQDAFYNIQDYFTDDLKQKMLSHSLTEQEKKSIQNEVCSFIKKYYDKAFNIIIKNGYIQRITNCTTVLDLCGLLSKNNVINNFRLSYLDIDFLGYDYYDNNANNIIKRPSITSLMNENFIKNYNTDELIALSAFYCNRLAKCSIEYNDMLYLLYKTDTLHKYMKDPNYKFDLSDDKISTILAQHSILEKASRLYMEKKIKTNQRSFSDVYLYEDINTPEISSFLHKYGANYSSEFDQMLPDLNNDILKDLEKSIALQTTVNNAYIMKKHSLESLLLMLIDKNKEKNWGVVLEKIDGSKYDKDKNNNLLIGIDMKEFNMPVKLHCSKEQIEEFMINYTGKPIIPVYKGNDDFIIDNTYYSTQILNKLSKEQRKLLHKTAEAVKPSDKKYKLIKHLQWMSHPNRTPEFIDNTKQYYNLETEEIIDEKDLEKNK